MELPKNGLELYSLIYKKCDELSYIHWGTLKFSFAKFLTFYPLSEKELIVYNKLSDNVKLPYLTRRLIKSYKKHIGNTQLLNLFFDTKKDYAWIKKYHNPSTTKIETWELKNFDENDELDKLLIKVFLRSKVDNATIRTNDIKSLLCKVTSSLIIELCQKSLDESKSLNK